MTRSILTTTAVLAMLASPAVARSGETLDVAAQFEIQGPEPSISGYIFTRMGISETLVNAEADGRLTPGLASDWQVAEDGLSWTFTLQDGVRFHDDTAMTADAVVNAGHPFLSQPEARRARSLAIDREGIARAVLRYPQGATQLFPPSVAGWHDDALPPLGHDVEEARALLEGLGWLQGSDGILTRDGERFTLTLTTYPDRPELPLVAAVLEQQFRQIGVELTINTTNSSEIPAGHQNGTLELGLVARNFSLIPDPIGTVLSDYVGNGDWGAMNWHNEEFATLVGGIARGEGDDADRAEAAAILQDELPIIPIAWYQQTLAVSDKVEGATIDPFERSFGLQDMRWAE
ncbi:ABC transporter substrate-binding protein [Paracoccus seriniphilus]|nr:ABC transporter substrate-binding protein [Paracoccus seriniphilus]WCR12892.1 hypothetical protein JHW44_07950 [Paracoccus seriniphilus]